MELVTRTLGDFSGREVVVEDFTSHGVTVPAGFIFDGASTPRPFWWIIPPYKKTKKASLIHDYLCYAIDLLEDGKEASRKRKAADQLFRIMLVESGVTKFEAYLGYSGLRIWAWVKETIGVS